MHVYIIFCHPSRQSFTYSVLYSFTAGLKKSGHTYEIGDLYAMDFQTDMEPEQYNRESGTEPELSVPEDVAAEQAKIDKSDALVFIYPVWWSDCPAKLKGWFDRVWTVGYAYSYENREHSASRIKIKKALALCPAGHPVEYLEAIGIAGSMRKIMLDDRLRGVGIKNAGMEILGGMISQDPDIRDSNLSRAYDLGQSF